MTDRDLEQRLRGWFHAEVGDDEPAPVDLHAVVAAIPRSTPVSVRRLGRRHVVTLLAAAALLLGGALAAGSALLHVPSVVVPPSTRPAPTSAAIATVSPSAAPASATPGPSPAVAPALGGGQILVRDAPRDAAGVPLDTVHGFPTGTYDIFTMDVGSGERTLLGTIPYDWTTGFQPEVAWARDQLHILITDRRGRIWALDAPTAAGRRLISACCEQPGVVGWVMSPLGDRIAGLHQVNRRVAGQQGETQVTDSIVVTNVDGTDMLTLPLPPGSDLGAVGENQALTWAPDASALALAGCRPCNYAEPGRNGSVIAHSRLFILALDGSPVRDILDETMEGVWGPTWSPDGASIVVGRRDCAPKEVQPYCIRGRLRVASINVADGAQTILADTPMIASGPFLSPDGRRIAYGTQRMDVVDEKGGIFVMDADGTHLVRLSDGFDPRWSRDGQWILYEATPGDLWAVSAAGGEPRHIGSGGAAAW